MANITVVYRLVKCASKHLKRDVSLSLYCDTDDLFIRAWRSLAVIIIIIHHSSPHHLSATSAADHCSIQWSM